MFSSKVEICVFLRQRMPIAIKFGLGIIYLMIEYSMIEEWCYLFDSIKQMNKYYQGYTIIQCYIYISRTHKNTILHIQGNTRYCQRNDRKEALVIILGNW